jgi:ATP-binding cassette subfamily B protein/subfamily B ATP-binding cassette protein MsbA
MGPDEHHGSSRSRFHRYRERVRDRQGANRSPSPQNDAAGKPRRGRGFGTLLRAFLSFLAGHRALLGLALCTLSVATLVGLVPLYGTKLVFDNVLGPAPLPDALRWLPGVPDAPRALLGWIAIVMVLISILALIVRMWSRWQTTRVSKRVAVLARRRLFDHVIRLPLHRIYHLKSGGVASVLREDAGGIGDLVFSLIYNPWRAIVQLLGSLTVLLFIDWRMLLGSLALIPTVWYTHRTWISRIRPFWRDIRQTRQGVDAHATEAFGGIRVVRGFGRQRTEAARFTTSNHLMARQELHAWWWMRGVDAAWAVLVPLATALLLWYGGGRVLDDAARVNAGLLDRPTALSVGDLVVFLAYLTALLGPIATLAQSAASLQNNLAGLDRTLDLLDEPIDMPTRPGATRPNAANTRGHIRIEGVSFTYPGTSNAVLEAIDLEVQPGQTVALVGRSGAGKTTLCNLVARFYDPTSGVIRLDNVDLRNIAVGNYRALLGIVEQDTFLFDGTIAENLSYARRHCAVEDIHAAARLACADLFIEKFDAGYDTLIGERGVRLSGGQRQRLAIARAILADPCILILDEATSNLDTESEQMIQQALHALMSERTTFVIAHRLSTIAGADRIVVLEDGRIVEQGTHAELIERSGRYRTMVDLQTHPGAPSTGTALS